MNLHLCEGLVLMWWSEDVFWKLVLSFCCVGFWYWIHVIILGSNVLYPLNHLSKLQEEIIYGDATVNLCMFKLAKLLVASSLKTTDTNRQYTQHTYKHSGKTSTLKQNSYNICHCHFWQSGCGSEYLWSFRLRQRIRSSGWLGLHRETLHRNKTETKQTNNLKSKSQAWWFTPAHRR